MKIPFDTSARTSLIVPMTVQDRAGKSSWDLSAAVDTGASYCFIPWEAARFLGYLSDEMERVRVVSGEGVVYAPRIVLGRIDVGTVGARDVEAVCRDLPEEAPVDALLGLSFLTRFRLSFDFDAWEMELTPRG